MKIVIAGGTGFIGTRLIQALLPMGHQVVLLSRKELSAPSADSNQLQTVLWDGAAQGEWSQSLSGADAVVNLCGESIASKRWTSAQKEKLRSSRILPTRAIVQAIKQASIKPKTLINVSAVGFYGSVDEGEVDERYEKGDGFLADLCSEWEDAAVEARQAGVRVVLPRIGIVLEAGEGALAKMIPPFKWFIGGPLGSGKQWFPWVHIDDLIGMILFSIKNEEAAGPFNATAPHPARMRDFCRSLGKVLDRPSWAPVPGFVLRALLGEMADMLLGGQRAIPFRMLNWGFSFRYPILESALISILK